MESTNTKNSHIRILHCSDIHLDTPFSGLSGEKSDERRRELRGTFMRVMQYVRDRGIHICLLSGDLFDTRYATNMTAEVLIREFRNCPETVFIISPGKSDFYQDNPIYTSGRLPSNVYVFKDENLSRFDFESYNVSVYGWAFVKEEMKQCPLADRHVEDSSRVNIVCGYGDLGGALDSEDCPMTEAMLREFGADYYALGSHHTSSEFVKLDDTIYSYCGSLECTGFEDTGIGGANLIVVDLSDGELAIDVKRLNFGHLKFVNAEIDVTGVNTNNEIINRISRLISDKKYGIETALHVDLVGAVDPRFLVANNLECEAFGLYYFALCDKTLPLYGASHFERDMTTAGEVFRKLLPGMKSENEEDRLTAARAFRVALAALENREVDL